MFTVVLVQKSEVCFLNIRIRNHESLSAEVSVWAKSNPSCVVFLTHSSIQPDLSSPQGDEMMLLHLLEMQGRGGPDHRRPWSKPGLGGISKCLGLYDINLI